VLKASVPVCGGWLICDVFRSTDSIMKTKVVETPSLQLVECLEFGGEDAKQFFVTVVQLLALTK